MNSFTIQNDDRCFVPLCTAMAGLYSISAMRNAQKNGVASSVKLDESVTIFGKSSSGVQLVSNLYDFLQPISENTWPDKLAFTVEPLNEPAKHPDAMATGRMGITWALMGHCYLTFFESVSDDLKSKLGQDWTTWNSKDAQFGYQIQNAVAHSGQIHFNNPNAPAVAWRNLTYDYSNNGRPVFDDITTVEFILLMRDTESIL